MRAVIREVTTPLEVQGCGFRICAAPEPLAVWEATERFSKRVEEPPFWAHAWPGGIALAQWVTPERVGGKRVLDFAAGGGVSAVAAKRAGAASVLATELDAWALAAIAENAALNSLELAAEARDVVGLDEGWDVVLVGDVFYESEPSRRIFEWLLRLHVRGALVAIGDPGRSFLPRDRLELVFTAQVTPTPAWDSVVDRPARVWQIAKR